MTETFGKPHDEIVRELAALRRIRQVGAHGREEPVRRALERAGAEHEHESAAAPFAPLDAADAADPRVNRPPEHIEAHDVADVDAEALDDAFFDRDFGKRTPDLTPVARTSGKRPSISVSFDFELAAIGDRVLARQHAAPLQVFDLVEVHALARDPRAQHGNEQRLRLRRQPLGEKRLHVGGLVLLNVDEKHVRRVLADLQRELIRAGSPAGRARP